MKAGVMGEARRRLWPDARKLEVNSDIIALALSVFTMLRPPYRGDMKRGSWAAKHIQHFPAAFPRDDGDHSARRLKTGWPWASE
jgi:hypothetical protein